MTSLVTQSLRPMLAAAALTAAPLSAQFIIDPDFTLETPELLISQPDLDGDGVPDLVLVDRSTGLIRGALRGGGLSWLDPVPGGIAGAESLATGPFEATGAHSIAITSEAANRINVFSLDGVGLNPAPRTVFNDGIGIQTFASIEEARSENSTTELIGASNIYDPTGPAVRDFITSSGSLQSYSPGFATPDHKQRMYRHVLVEEGLPMLTFIDEDVASGTDLFNLIYTLDGAFELVGTIEIADDAEFIHASFTLDGLFQFIFHVPGSASIAVHTWTGGGLDPVGSFALDEPAAQLFPFASEAGAGFFAQTGDGTGFNFYSFNGEDPPAYHSTINPLSELPVQAVVTGPEGELILLSGPDGSPATHAELFQFDGTSFGSEGDLNLPSPASLPSGSNVLLFANTPFIDPAPSLTGRLGAGVWTSAVVVGSDVVADVEEYGNSGTGLVNPTPVNLGATPPDTSDALGNQVADDISLFDDAAPIGVVPGTVEPVPAPGSYNESLTVQLVSSDPSVTIFYRIPPDGSWNIAGAPIGPFFQDFSIQYLAIAPDGRRTPIETASYDILSSPDDLDSDGDGVPDYVEIANGLDPVNSGDDGDGDGFSDEMELFAGTDPTNSASTPPSREVDTDGDGVSDFEETIAGTDPGDPASRPASDSVLNLQTVFDVVGTPLSHDGNAASDPTTLPLAEELETPGGEPLAAQIRLFAPSGALKGYDRTANHSVASALQPNAWIEAVSVDYPNLFLVLATGSSFKIDVAAPDRQIGRQIAALVKVPEAVYPPVPYNFGDSGGDPATEAAGWVNAARNHLLAQERPVVVREFDLFDTLVLLLAEMKVESTLRERGLIGADPISFTSFRPNESAVSLSEAPNDGSRNVVVPASMLNDLRHLYGGADTGLLLDRVCDVIDACVDTDSDPRVLALRNVAEEIYRISAAEANDSPGAFVPPLDALRQFLRSGSLNNTGYLSDPEIAPLDAATLASAQDGVAYILGKDMARPVETRNLRVTAQTESVNGCTILEDSLTSQSVALLNFIGDAYALPDAFAMPEDAIVTVQGYTDVTGSCGADVTLEVIPPIQLVSLPVGAPEDLDGDLIPDALEDLFMGEMDTFGDSDGDGYSDLQEALEGTNPFSVSSMPSGDPADLTPPTVAVQENPTTVQFSFAFPASYADDVAFELFSGATLEAMTSDTGFEAADSGGGQFQLTISKPSSYPKFYRFRMSLK